jgi:hypothetical protein
MGQTEQFMKKYRGNLIHLLLEEYADFSPEISPESKCSLSEKCSIVHCSRCSTKMLSSIQMSGSHMLLAFKKWGERFIVNSGAVLDGRGEI